MTTNKTDTDTQRVDAAPSIDSAKSSIVVPADLESRIKARRAEIIARLVELKADATIEAVETRDKLKAKLSELGHIVKQGVVDGWASLGDVAKRKLDRWLDN